MNQASGGEPWMYACYGVQHYAPTLWVSALDFLRAYYQSYGLPTGHADIDIFFGGYDRTPHGIHRDPADNFSFVIAGQKRMLFWPPESFEAFDVARNGHIGLHAWESYAESAIIVDAEPGDVIFWPKEYWHIAVAQSGEALTMNIALYEAPSPWTHLTSLLSKWSRGTAQGKALSGQDVVAQLESIVDCAQDSVVRYALVREELRSQSAGAFKALPPRRSSRSFRGKDRIRQVGYVATREIGDTLLVASNGWIVGTGRGDQTLRILRLLGRKRGCLVSEIVTRAGPGQTGAAMRLLNDLWRARGIAMLSG
jgi:hypothetical protein